MVWVFVAAGGAGFLLGLRFKVSALAVASGLTLLACIPFALFADMGLLSVVFVTFGLLATLQVGYLGAVLAVAWARARTSSPPEAIEDDGPKPELEETPAAPPLRRVSGG
jgi:hypothetical protein